MTSRETYTHRADEAHRYAVECKAKMRYKPDSAASYAAMSDRTLAEGYLWDSAARNVDDDPKRMVAAMRREQAQLERGGSSAFEHDRFVDHVRMLLDNFETSAEAGDHP